MQAKYTSAGTAEIYISSQQGGGCLIIVWSVLSGLHYNKKQLAVACNVTTKTLRQILQRNW